MTYQQQRHMRALTDYTMQSPVVAGKKSGPHLMHCPPGYALRTPSLP